MEGGINLFAYVNNPINWTDPLGLFGWADMPTIPQPISDFSAGFGDVVSLGLTNMIRKWVGINDVVDKCSGWYKAGGYTGDAWWIAFTLASAGSVSNARGALGSVEREITGYTRHGLNQAISREGVGVSSQAILDAVRNPVQVVMQENGTIRFIGQNAQVVLNQAGKVVTTWARNSGGWRIIP